MQATNWLEHTFAELKSRDERESIPFLRTSEVFDLLARDIVRLKQENITLKKKKKLIKNKLKVVDKFSIDSQKSVHVADMPQLEKMAAYKSKIKELKDREKHLLQQHSDQAKHLFKFSTTQFENQKTIGKQQHELEQKDAQIAELEEKLDQIQNVKLNTLKEKQFLTKELASLGATKAKMREQVELAETELKEYKKLFEDQRRAFQLDIENYRKESDDLKAEIDVLTVHNTKLTQENAKLQSIVEHPDFLASPQLQRRFSERDLLAKPSYPSKLFKTVKIDSRGINDVCFQRDSSRFYCGCENGVLQKYHSTTGELDKEFTEPDKAIMSITNSRDDKLIAAGSRDYGLHIWHAATGKHLWKLMHNESVTCVEFGPTSKRIVSGANDRKLKIWDVEFGRCIGEVNTGSRIHDVCWSGESICVANYDKKIRFYDARTNRIWNTISCHNKEVTSVCLSNSGNYLLSNGKDSKLNLIDLKTNRLVKTFKDPEYYTNKISWNSASFTFDDKFVVAGSFDGAVVVWDVETAKTEEIIKDGRPTAMTSVTCSPDGNTMIAAGLNKQFYIWR